MAKRAMGKVDYMKRDSLVNAVQTIVQEKTFKKACAAAQQASQMAYEAAQNRGSVSGGWGFMSVTGNLLESMGVTVSRYDTKSGAFTRARMYAPIARGGGKRPNGPALAGGEVYDVDKYGKTYFSGAPVPEKNPYKAPKSGLGGTRGRDERKAFNNMIPGLSANGSQSTTNSFFGGAKGNFWNILVFVAQPYARMVEAKHDYAKGTFVNDMAMWVADALSRAEGGNEYGGQLM